MLGRRRFRLGIFELFQLGDKISRASSRRSGLFLMKSNFFLEFLNPAQIRFCGQNLSIEFGSVGFAQAGFGFDPMFQFGYLLREVVGGGLGRRAGAGERHPEAD